MRPSRFSYLTEQVLRITTCQKRPQQANLLKLKRSIRFKAPQLRQGPLLAISTQATLESSSIVNAEPPVRLSTLPAQGCPSLRHSNTLKTEQQFTKARLPMAVLSLLPIQIRTGPSQPNVHEQVVINSQRINSLRHSSRRFRMMHLTTTSVNR